jgi:hypothetical protein
VGRSVRQDGSKVPTKWGDLSDGDNVKYGRNNAEYELKHWCSVDGACSSKVQNGAGSCRSRVEIELFCFVAELRCDMEARKPGFFNDWFGFFYGQNNSRTYHGWA